MDKPPVLVAEGLEKTYGKGMGAVQVLHGLNLTLTPGELLVILGPSGSGKSTLLNLLGLMDKPDKGEIHVGGRAASHLDEEGRARLRNEHLGFVFQFDSLMHEFTALENVVMPAKIRGDFGSEARGLELLDQFGLKSLRDRLPTQMSGGERQRVALCRALLNKPGVILADEPTGNLDKHNGELVFKDLRRLADGHGAAVVLVTHNESAGAYAHRILHMADGTLEPNPERVKG